MFLCFLFLCRRRLYNLFPNGSGYGYNTVVNDDFLQTSSFAESNDVSKLLTTFMRCTVP